MLWQNVVWRVVATTDIERCQADPPVHRHADDTDLTVNVDKVTPSGEHILIREIARNLQQEMQVNMCVELSNIVRSARGFKWTTSVVSAVRVIEQLCLQCATRLCNAMCET